MAVRLSASFVAVALVGLVVACGGEPQAVPVRDGAELTVPRQAAFSESALRSMVAPDMSGRLGGSDNLVVGILDDVQVVDCEELSTWLGATLDSVPGYSLTCGVISMRPGLPERRGHVGPDGGPLEYTVELEFAPDGLDLRSTSSTEAFDRGLIDVALRYNSQSWNGISTEPTNPVSEPTNETDGGFVYGTIDGRLAIVQRMTDTSTRLQTTLPVDGDVFTLVVNGNLTPPAAVELAAALPLLS